MLQDRAGMGAHGGPDEFAATYHDLTARWSLEARHCRPGPGELQIDIAAGEFGFDTESLHRVDQRSAYQPVGVLQAAWQRPVAQWRHNRVSEFEVVEQRPAAGRSSNDVDALSKAEVEIGSVRALMPAEGQARRVPAVEAQGRW
ncbi:MAG: hypothetical protein MUP13_02750 [Thermoanaerobaculales bacterium]|nr:hypothetical protein [Thermoanaerobaculales bacterium]